MQRCKHRRKFCFVMPPLPKKFFDTFWESLIRLDLKRGFVPKKAYAYKAPSWLVFQTARVGSRRAFFPTRQLRSIQLRGTILLCALPPARGVRHTKNQCTAKEYGQLSRLYSCIISYLSSQVN